MRNLKSSTLYWTNQSYIYKLGGYLDDKLQEAIANFSLSHSYYC